MAGNRRYRQQGSSAQSLPIARQEGAQDPASCNDVAPLGQRICSAAQAGDVAAHPPLHAMAEGPQSLPMGSEIQRAQRMPEDH